MPQGFEDKAEARAAVWDRTPSQPRTQQPARAGGQRRGPDQRENFDDLDDEIPF